MIEQLVSLNVAQGGLGGAEASNNPLAAANPMM